MEESDYTSLLPKVEQSDLLTLVLEETQDPQQTERWKHLAATNPILAREVMKRCFIETRQLVTTSGEIRHLELQRIAKQVAIYALTALEAAAERIQKEARPPTTSGDADDAVPIPLI